jgi:preprotein translocase subunit SecD
MGLGMALLLLVHPAMSADIELAVETAEVGHDPFTAQPSLEVVLTPEARKVLGKLTLEHTGDIIELWVDGELMSSPVVQTPILEGSLVITGAMTAEEARLLAARLDDHAAVITLRPIAR